MIISNCKYTSYYYLVGMLKKLLFIIIYTICIYIIICNSSRMASLSKKNKKQQALLAAAMRNLEQLRLPDFDETHLSDRKLVLAILRKYEEIFRGEGQAFYKQNLRKTLTTFGSEDKIRSIVLNHFGFNSLSLSMKTFKRIKIVYAGDQEVRDSVTYLRFNRILDWTTPETKIGDIIVNFGDLPIYTLDGKRVNVKDLIGQDFGMAVVAAFSSS